MDFSATPEEMAAAVRRRKASEKEVGERMRREGRILNEQDPRTRALRQQLIREGKIRA
jgi:hypothetical protein